MTIHILNRLNACPSFEKNVHIDMSIYPFKSSKHSHPPLKRLLLLLTRTPEFSGGDISRQKEEGEYYYFVMHFLDIKTAVIEGGFKTHKMWCYLLDHCCDHFVSTEKKT